MSTWSTDLPALLVALHRLDFYIEDGEEIDFELYQSFFPSEENASWFKVWTGNVSVDGAQFRVFGKDGTGGYAAFCVKFARKNSRVSMLSAEEVITRAGAAYPSFSEYIDELCR